MSAVVLRPNGTITAADSLTGGATAHAVTSDDSDASYFTDNDTVVLDFGTTTVGTGSIIKQFRFRWRGRGDAGLAIAKVGIGDLYSLTYTDVTTTLATRTAAYITPSAPVPAGVFSGTVQDVIDLLGVQGFVDALTMEFDPGYGVLAFGADAMRGYEAYIDLVYVTIPVAVVTAVTDPYTASTIVPIAWTNTLDSDGGAQTRYEVKVFTDAQYGAGGFDPATSTPYYTTGEVISSALTANVGPLENADTYRAYVRVAQTVNGASHWSAWAFDEFTMDVSTADVDTVVGSPGPSESSILVTVTRDGASEAWEFVEVQRSIDAGTTWTDVRGATYVDSTGNATTFTVTDYETPNGQATLYRARATYLSSGLPITGSWTTSASISWASDLTWLKAPTDPTLNMTLCMSARMPYRRNRRSGVFQVLGRAAPVVVSDVRSSRSGSLIVETDTTDEADDLVALLDGSPIVLVQFPPEFDIDDKYIAVLSDEELFRSMVAGNVWREWSIEYVEVNAPADPDAG